MVTCPNASFTDLAEIVSRIEPVKPAVVDGKTFVCLLHVCLPRLTLSARRPSLVTVFDTRLFPCHFFNTCSHTMGSSCPPSEESDYHTDYEEEALESALSDMEPYSFHGEHTEGEETGDTVGNPLVPCCLLYKISPSWGQLINNPISYIWK